MKSKFKTFKTFVMITAFILSSVSIISQAHPGLASKNTSSSMNQSLPVVTFYTTNQATNTLDRMIADFNANFSATYGFRVNLIDNYFGTTSLHDTFLAYFKSKSTLFDVLSMDDTWVAEFAGDSYLLPLNDVFNSSYQSQFFQGDIATGTYNGHIFSVPWFHNSGMLYYRSDVLQYAFNNGIIPADRPPQTWADLSNWTLAMMQDQSLVTKFNLTSGFVWQGKSSSGLIPELMEYLGGTGIYSFLSSSQSTTDFKNSSGLQDALRYMKNLITSSVSPKSVLNSDEEINRAVWNAGNAIFMRNWPYAYPLSLNSAQLNGSLVSGAEHNIQQFNVTTMPAENSSVVNPKTSGLGGWTGQLGVNTFSTRPNDAKRLIMWLTASEQQSKYFLGTGNLPTLKEVYNSPAILQSKEAYIRQYLPIFESSISWPVTPDYQQINNDLTPVIDNYLGGNLSLESAINTMSTRIKSISNQNPLFGSFDGGFPFMVGAFIIGLMACIAIIMYYPQYKKRGIKQKGKNLVEKDSGTFTGVSKRICNTCGSKINPEDSFCKNCGNKI